MPSFPSPTPASPLRDIMREDMLMLLDDLVYSMPTDTVYHKRKEPAVIDTVTGEITYLTDTYSRRAIMTKYQPRDEDVPNFQS